MDPPPPPPPRLPLPPPILPTGRRYPPRRRRGGGRRRRRPLVHVPPRPPEAGSQVRRDHPRGAPIGIRQEHRCEGEEGRARPEHCVRAGERAGRGQQAAYLGEDRPD